MSARRQITEPETRVGICCGDACKAAQHSSGTWNYALLFKVQGIFRYRCATCFETETGHRHHMAHTDPVSA
jgi:hypothetical protein